ncbi:MAG TPA: SDR family oxidoreductase [Armatimonadota bacterium]|jgi:glucose 1-dehydrogenase
MLLEGRRALITGANTGIGRAIALRYAEEGADVAVNYVAHPEAAERVVKQIEKRGRRAVAVLADVTQVDQIASMVAKAVEALGGLDICVNNAGVQKEVPFLKVTEQDWDLMVNVDLRGAFFVSQACAREMVKAGHGAIINVTSVHQEVAKPRFAPYCAAKGGVGMLTKTLAMELAPHRIRVNGVAPGAIITPMNEDVIEDKAAKESVCEEIPWGRFGRASEVAGLAAWLASREADYVTGATYLIDGGLSQQVVDYKDPGQS